MSESVTHNHPPRCCCSWVETVNCPRIETPCPICPEHGELAQLGNSRAIRPAALEELEPTDAAHDAAVAAALAGTRLAGPCSSCHQLAQRPPTEYCQTPELHDVQP